MDLITIDASFIVQFLEKNREAFAQHYIDMGSSQEQADIAISDLNHYVCGDFKQAAEGA